MNNTTYWRPDLAELAYHYQNDETAVYIAEKCLPMKGLRYEKGSFRAPTEDAYFNQPNMKMNRTGYPNSFNFTDATVNYDLAPYGGSFELSNIDLAQPDVLGYASKADMIARNVEWLATQARLDLEIRFAEFMQTAALYASGYYVDINGTSTKWNDLNNSDPLKDVLDAKKTLLGVPTDMIIGQEMLFYLMQHPKLTSATTVMGSKKDRSVNPLITVEFLSNYFGIQNVWVAGGIYNSSPNTPSTLTKGWIWNSAYVWIGTLDKAAGLNPKAASFANALALQTPEMRVGNFIAKETVDERAGGVGLHYFDVVFYMQYKVRMQKLGYLMYNCIV